MTAATSRVAPLYGGFFLNGIVAVMLGPLIPELEETWRGGHAAAASLFLVQFAVSSVGAVVSSFRPRLSLILGYASISAGLLSLAGGLSWGDGEGFFGWPFARVAMALVGLGLGLTIAATNLTVSHRNPRRRGAALATVNLVWGFGATGCPLLFATLLGRYPAAVALWSFSALAALASLTLWITFESEPVKRSREATIEPTGTGRESLTALLMLAAMFFLYVGSENAIGGWVVALSDQLGQGRAVASMLIHSSFWGAILAGRATAAVVLRHVGEPTVYKASLALACAGTLTILLAGSRTGVAAGALLAGFGCAPLFPLSVSILTAQTAATGSRDTGWIFACGGIGGAVLPWLTGQVAAETGLVSRGFAVPMAGLALLAILFGLHRVFYSG